MSNGDRIEKIQRKPSVPFTAKLKKRYLKLFRNHPELGGRMVRCAEAVGVSKATVEYHLKHDPEFKEALEEARQAWIDENLFQPALQRARNGVSRPIIGGRFRNEVVTTVQEYSDNLLLAMLRAYNPEFRDPNKASGAGASGQGGVMVVPAAPVQIEEWQSLFSKKAQGQPGAPGEGQPGAPGEGQPGAPGEGQTGAPEGQTGAPEGQTGAPEGQPGVPEDPNGTR